MLDIIWTTAYRGKLSSRTQRRVKRHFSVDGADTECHKKLMENGVYIVENLCHLDEIGASRCMTVGTFPAVKGASGTWVRLLALV